MNLLPSKCRPCESATKKGVIGKGNGSRTQGLVEKTKCERRGWTLWEKGVRVSCRNRQQLLDIVSQKEPELEKGMLLPCDCNLCAAVVASVSVAVATACSSRFWLLNFPPFAHLEQKPKKKSHQNVAAH